MATFLVILAFLKFISDSIANTQETVFRSSQKKTWKYAGLIGPYLLMKKSSTFDFIRKLFEINGLSIKLRILLNRFLANRSFYN